MNKFTKYKKAIDEEKDRIVALYGVDITNSLFHEYYKDLHSMDMKRDFSQIKDDQELISLERDLAKDNFVSNEAQQIFEKEVLCDTDTTS